MNKRLVIVELLNMVSGIVKETNEILFDRQRIDHANQLFLETVKNHDDIIMVLNELFEMKKNGVLTEKTTKRIAKYLIKSYKDQIALNEVCISILDSTHRQEF